MKKLLLVFLILWSLNGYSQDQPPVNEETGNIEYIHIVEVEGVSKDNLFLFGHEWFAHTFRSSKDVVEYSNQEIGKIIGKGSINIDATGSGAKGTIHFNQAGYVSFTIEYAAKESKYRCVVSNLYHTGTQSGYSGGDFENNDPLNKSWVFSTKTWKSIKTQAHHKVLGMLESLDNFITNRIHEDDDW